MQDPSKSESEAGVTSPREGGGAARRRALAGLNGLLALGVLVLLVFPVAARLTADRQPIAPAHAVRLLELPARAPDARLRDLPALSGSRDPPTAVAALRGELRRVATHVLGRARGRRLVSVVEGQGELGVLAEQVAGGFGPARYPFRYPPLASILAGLPPRLPAGEAERANDLGALLVLAAAMRGRPESLRPPPFPNAAPAAFAILDRARRGGECLPQLNLAFLLAAAARPRVDEVSTEARRAARACPGDPTALWLLGELQSQLASRAADADQRRRPFVTFRALQRRYPRSAVGWSGEADAHLRLAFQYPDRPFSARRRFQIALALYRRAQRLQPDPGLLAGIARSHAALGQAGAALAAQRRALALRPGSEPLLAHLVERLEAARRFGAAAMAAARLAAMGGAGFPDRPAMFPAAPTNANHRLAEHDAFAPLSLGSDRLVSLSEVVLERAAGGPGSVLDLSFIPSFRPAAGLTGSQHWCPGWSRRRDLVLAGRPAAALAGFPESFRDIRPNRRRCEAVSFDAPGILAGIAELERGNPKAAVRRAVASLVPSDEALTRLQDNRQNLWRWAGELPRAAASAREWLASAPSEPLPRLRLGEIHFLQRRFGSAAGHFAAAARRARTSYGVWTADEAEALLGQGAALAAAGRREPARRVLADADEVASRRQGLDRREGRPDRDGSARLAYLSYYARAQAGDVERELRDHRAAAEAYAAAREREPELDEARTAVRFEGLDNNEAIVDIGLGRLRAATIAARRAVAADPHNPAFLMTAGYAEARRGRSRAASRLYRAALASDPTTFPAANDLGVLLARQDRHAEAARVLRRAVGADEGYALGWFNLGVVLGRMGPAHLLPSQGALARAFALEPALRERQRRPTFDARTYATGLDLSKPLPPRWSFARSQPRATAAAAGLAAVLLLGVALGRSLLARSGRELSTRWLELAERASERIPGVKRLRPPGVAVAVALGVLLWPLLRGPGGSLTATVAILLGTLTLVGVALGARAAIARRHREELQQATWPPSLLFGIGATLASLSWTPLPYVRSRHAGPEIHWIGPAVTGSLALALLVLAIWLEVPLTRTLGASALVMCASLLTPIKPLDGAAIAARGGGAASLAALGIGALLLIGAL